MTLKNIYKRFSGRISITLAVVLVEGLLFVLFPLLIGVAIQSVIDNEYTGLYMLAALCLAVLIVGAGRRFYDSRIYGGIYVELSTELSNKKQNTSVVTANVNLLREVVEFFENSLPSIINNIIGLVGTLFLLIVLNVYIFLGCLAIILIIVAIYWLSSGKTLRYNHEYNNEYEKQVNILDQKSEKESGLHFRRMMKWNIRLSDLETYNFSGVWFAMSVLLCLSILIVLKNDDISYGVVFSIVMYVFQFIESSINLPFYYQETLRLKDISHRLSMCN